MRPLHFLALCLAASSSAPLAAQSTAYIFHAFPDVCEGRIVVPSADSVHWSTGATGLELIAPAGTYSFTAFFQGVEVEEEHVIESHGWELQMMAMPYYGGLQLSGHVSIEHCGTSLWNHPCCTPDEETTELRLLQDGEPYDIQDCFGCSGVWCAVGSFMIGQLPFGHLYQLVIFDPDCAGTVIHPAGMLIAHSCADLEVITEVVDPTEGGADGVIHFVEAVPDPNEPYPISSPVTGTAMLTNATTQEVVGLFDAVGSATWDGLVAGYYVLTFIPDQTCQTYTDTLTVGTFTTGVLAGDTASGLSLFPAVTDGMLQISSQAGGPVSLDIHDMHGRLVERTVVQGRVDVGHFPAGAYIATMQQGARQLRTRFIKR